MSKARDWIAKISQANSEQPKLTIAGKLVAEVDYKKADCLLHEADLNEQQVQQLIAFLEENFT